MPVISTSFNRFLGTMLGISCLQSASLAQIPSLSPAELDWLGAQIYQNECNRDFRCLTSWNAGEEFPSLGIGHFIWYQPQQQAPFEETFPELLWYLKSHAIELPDWIAAMETFESPWQNRDQFLKDMDSERMVDLRHFLEDTKSLQAQFIAQRLQATREELLAAAPANLITEIETNFNSVMEESPPLGLYALIDYLHFKGSGLKQAERYRGQGWGLLDVLLGMGSTNSLAAFVESADYVLTRRVSNAPPQRNEQRWLPGWRNRLKTYLQ